MKKPVRLLPLLVVTALPVLAVYAPIPEQEQGKALSFRLGASVAHDSNIFGSATGEISSMVYSVSPGLSFNSSVTDQTFVSFTYDLSVDHIEDRPDKKDLSSHTLSGRLAHQFSQSSNLDLSDSFVVARNPQSLLNGVALNADQSLQSNEFDARATTALAQKTGLVLKYRHLFYAYDNSTLAAALDRTEQLAGLEANYALLPRAKLAGEYRYQDIAYDTSGATKDKRSHFFLGGVDYHPGETLLTTLRLGAEARSRESERHSTAPFAELSVRHTYQPGSFLAGGCAYTYEESSDVARFTDSKVNRFFVNLQHRLTALLTVSSSLTYEPSQLQGRRGQVNLDETTTRLGLGLTWLPTKNWSITATGDLDKVASDDSTRDQARTRYGVSARCTF